MQEYGPADTDYGGSLYGFNNDDSHYWQITPNDNSTSLIGSWDIRQVPSITYLNDKDTNGEAPGLGQFVHVKLWHRVSSSLGRNPIQRGFRDTKRHRPLQPSGLVDFHRESCLAIWRHS